MSLSILIIEDEKAQVRALRRALETQNYTVLEAYSAQQGLAAAALQSPDLILLDLGLPDLDGLEVLRQLRSWSSTPVMILSIQAHERDKIAALDAGADDYLTKPCSLPELLARIRVTLRHFVWMRDQQSSPSILAWDELRIDRSSQRVTRAGKAVKLTKTEQLLLGQLARHAGKVLTHRQLLSAVWGLEYGEDVHYLQVYISRLRQKLEKEPSRPQLILTESGVGYRLNWEPA